MILHLRRVKWCTRLGRGWRDEGGARWRREKGGEKEGEDGEGRKTRREEDKEKKKMKNRMPRQSVILIFVSIPNYCRSFVFMDNRMNAYLYDI